MAAETLSKAKGDLNVEDLYLNRAKFVMKCLGVWVRPDDETTPRKLYRILMMSLQYVFLVFQIIYILQVWGDLEAVSQTSYVLFTQASLCFKVTVFQLNMGMLKDILARMSGEVFKPQSSAHVETLKIHARRIKKLLLSFVVSAQATCFCWALKPLFDDVNSRKFPLDMWMPVSPEQSPHYHIGFFLQYSIVSMSAYMYFGVDSVALSSIIFGCAQIDIVKEKIFTIKSQLPHNIPKKDRKEMLDRNYKKLVECAIQYQAVVSFIEVVEEAYHTYLAFQLTGNIGLICMTALRILVHQTFNPLLAPLGKRAGAFFFSSGMVFSTLPQSQVEWRSMQFISILVYMCVMLNILYICCWCGQELTSTSEDLHRVLYKCSWYEQDVRFKRALNFVMMRASRPLVLRAGHYIPLSRQTFVAILRTSYSYYAVLNRTMQRN